MVRDYSIRHDTSEKPFKYGDKTLVFSHFDNTFYCYNIVNVNGNFRGIYQSKTKLDENQ